MPQRGPLVAIAVMRTLLFALAVVTARPAADTYSDVSAPLRIDRDSAARNAPAVQIVETSGEGDNEEEDLLTWASRQHHSRARHQTQYDRHHNDVFLLVGARTSVVHSFARRQAIRQTWASAPSIPRGVKVVFLGCEPDLSMYGANQQQQLQEAIGHEKSVFGDLLTSELLECQDSYVTLPDKVKAFFHWATVTFPTLAFVMSTDDDTYLRLDQLVTVLHHPSTPTRRFYGGNAAHDWRGLGRTIRDPRDKYYIPYDVYPMYWLPPYLSGEHILLSCDLVHFLGRNFRDLRGCGTIEDVSIGLWLFSLLRIERTWLSEFQGLRFLRTCRDDNLISFSELSTFAVRRIHENLTHGRRYCEGYELSTWLKQPRDIQSAIDSSTTVTWNIQYDPAQPRLYIALKVNVTSSPEDFIYVPSKTSAEEGLCGHAIALLQRKHYLTAEHDLCPRICESILQGLDKTKHLQPALAPFLTIGLHNVERLLADDKDNSVDRSAIVAVLSSRSRKLRLLVECLLVQLRPRTRVFVWDDVDLPNRHGRVEVYVTTAIEQSSDRGAAFLRANTVFLIDEPSSQSREMTGNDPRVVTFTSTEYVDNARSSIYLPSVSRAFARTVKYTPMMLLKSHVGISTSGLSSRGLRVMSSCGEIDSTFSAFLQLLRGVIDTDYVDNLCACDRQSNNDHTPSGLCLDDSIELLQGSKFVVVAEADKDDGSDRMAMAFLAGSIPIYVGYAREPNTQPHLFQSQTFIDCRFGSTPEDCAHRVLQVHTSSELYEQMRHAAPITDLKVFEEVFSWHPGVVEEMMARNRPTGATRMSARLDKMLRH